MAFLAWGLLAVVLASSEPQGDCADTSEKGVVFSAPFPSAEFQGFYGALQAAKKEAAGMEWNVEALRARDKQFSAMVAEVEHEEVVYGGVSTAVFGKGRKSSVSGKYVLFMHGGGYVSGTPSGVCREFADRLSLALGATVISVKYALAPEHPLPQAVHDVTAVYDALLATGVSHDQVAIAGDSSGASLALLVLQLFVREGKPLPSSAVLISPWTDLTLSSSSWNDPDLAALDPIVAKEMALLCSRVAIGDAENRADPAFSPYFGSFAGLPPLYFIVGEFEILRSDVTLAHEKAEKEDKNKHALFVGRNLVHGFPLLPSAFPEAVMTIGRIASWIEKHWGKQ